MHLFTPVDDILHTQLQIKQTKYTFWCNYYIIIIISVFVCFACLVF